jgi:hypothetical protein
LSPKKEGQHSVKLNKEPKIINNAKPEILVYRQTPGRSLVIPIKFNNNIIKTTVDTADMITLADNRMFTEQQLSESQEFVKLQGLGNQEVMGKLIKSVEIKIGQLTILWDVCATKLTDTVLLGLYFLSAQQGLVNLKNLTITFGHETVGAEFAGSKANLTVSRVMVPENTTIFPKSMKSALVELEILIKDDYIIKPYSIHENILISASIGR